jgi:Xaa-Pro dipeptidase
MQQQKVAAFLVEAGSSLEYFTGMRWWRSERTTAA